MKKFENFCNSLVNLKDIYEYEEPYGNVEMTGMVLACVVAMAMSLVFYILDKFGLTNDQSQK